ncbi:hypothetical protein PFY10_07130 [Chryseobacterium daecheongense]|uniref:hypothetical protein n=1 Tax=Chryseobacterium sp. LAM-KRS1 TaxID=2715754 RepID=UPI001557D615|nr:hypothetical protein [Chryseobacterium sp. LAM-KRS1]WBV58216.1 hypothetical protein PFY10_07130 [Chryseobacterium daecheongense]
MTTESIYQSIKKWKTLIDAYKSGIDGSEAEILGYLNQGTHFSVSGKEIDQWKINLGNSEDPKIHAYLGIDEDRLKFFLIDSESDKTADFNDIVIREFTRDSPNVTVQNTTNLEIDPPITSESAINRNFRWNMYCTTWLKAQKVQDFVQIVAIPFADFDRLGLDGDQSGTCFFGLTDDPENASVFAYHVEIITVKDLTISEMSKTAENYSTPRPPFTAADPVDNYQLLKKSGAFL